MSKNINILNKILANQAKDFVCVWYMKNLSRDFAEVMQVYH